MALIAAAVWLPAGARAEAERKTGSIKYQRRSESYRMLARWIRDHELDELSLLTREPGFLTYHTRNPVIDGAGLVTPEIYVHGAKERRTPWEEIVKTWQPQLAVSNAMLDERDQMPGYVRVYTANQVKTLWMRKETFDQKLPAMAHNWLGDGYFPATIDPPGHPLQLDFEGDDPLRWYPNHAFRPVGRLKDQLSGTQGKVLHSYGVTAPLWMVSEPFRIDFDVLSFDLFANHERTRVELVVNGLTVLSRGGPIGRRDKMAGVVWPVHSWRGKIAVLRLVDVVPRSFLAIDRVRSSRYVASKVFDDFESGSYAPERWERSFAEKPCHHLQIARLHGLQNILGEFTAATVCTSSSSTDRVHLVSQPFRVDRRWMSFMVLDLAKDGRVELRSGGEVVERIHPQSGVGPVGVIWDLEKLRGHEAVLAVGGPAAPRGIGIDDIVLYDDLEP